MYMKKLLITHSDLDAVGCVVVFKYYNQEFDKIISMNYNEYENEIFKYDNLKKYDEIIYADFSPDIKSLEVIIENKIKTTIFDHHESFYNDIWNSDAKYKDCEFITYWYDKNKCGTKIVYDKLSGKRKPKALNTLVTLVDTYDLWKSDDDLFPWAQDVNRLMWKYANYAVQGYGKILKPIIEFLKKVEGFHDFFFTKNEQDMINDVKKKEKKVYFNACRKLLIRTDSKGHKFGITKCDSKISITLFNILKTRKDLDYIIGINTFLENRTGELKLSIRSLDNFNCLRLKYAKGHEKASGSENNDVDFINDLWKGKIYELGYRDGN